MQVRRLTPADHEAVARLLLAAYADHVAEEADYAEQLVDLDRRDREAEVWVALDGDDVVGTVTLCPLGSAWREIATDDEGEFRMLAVDPAAHGRGHGRTLSTWVVDELRRRGFGSVVLSSSTTMTTAHRLYESLGFERDPARDWSPTPHVDLLAYRLEL